MTLWPHYYIGKFSELPDPILDNIPVLNVNVLKPETTKVGSTYKTANCSAEVCEFPAGSTVFWFFDYDETHYVLSGEADLTYSLASTSHTEVKNAKIKQHDFYVVPTGCRLTWKVSPKAPLRLFWLTEPGIPAKRFGQRAKQAKKA